MMIGGDRRTGTVYVCTYCQAHSEQQLGRAIERDGSGGKQYDFKTQSGPPVSKGGCEHCGNALLVSFEKDTKGRRANDRGADRS